MPSELSFILIFTKRKLIFSDRKISIAEEWGSRKGRKEQLQRDSRKLLGYVGYVHYLNCVMVLWNVCVCSNIPNCAFLICAVHGQ